MSTAAGDRPDAPLLELRGIGKDFGSVIALDGISTTVRAGQVTCVLGDNGAGKSTLIKVLSGVHQPTRGQLLLDGEPVSFGAPREALDAGIATVFQDLAMIPLMAIWRNFFLGSEPTTGWGPFRRFDSATAKDVTRRELAAMGIDIRDPDQPVGTLSGGERQSVAIARAVHAREDLDQGGLACPVVAEHAGHLAGTHRGADAVEGDDRAEVLADAAKLEQRGVRPVAGRRAHRRAASA